MAAAVGKQPNSEKPPINRENGQFSGKQEEV
jgi:hypothetical protein